MIPRRSLYVFFAIITTCSPLAAWAAGEESIIDVLYLSRSSTWHEEGGRRRDLLMRVDPSIDVLAVETVGAFALWKGYIKPEQVNRKLRIYMPRNYERLIAERDLVILHDVPHSHPQEAAVQFDRKWISWFARAVEEDGMGLSMWGGDSSWGGQGEQNNPSWGETVLEPLLPFASIGGYNPNTFAGQALRPRFLDPGHPLARLPWNTAPPIHVLNKVKNKVGATLIAEAITSKVRYPWMAWWNYGGGRVTGEAQVFDSVGGGHLMREEWDWWQDFVIYLTYFGAGKAIPEDIYRAHRIREEINTHVAKASMLVSLLEFIEKFGANTARLYDDLHAINDLKAVAEEHFRKEDYDAASKVFEEIHKEWNELNVKAAKAKRNALIWVYLIEWLTVTSVALLSGLVLWSLMVRRRFFREIGITRIV